MKTGNVTTDNAHSRRNSIMTDVEFEALPDWSDVRDDSEYNEVIKWSLTNSRYSSKSTQDVPAMVSPAVDALMALRFAGGKTHQAPATIPLWPLADSRVRSRAGLAQDDGSGPMRAIVVVDTSTQHERTT